jgi:hypothetical protein
MITKPPSRKKLCCGIVYALYSLRAFRGDSIPVALQLISCRSITHISVWNIEAVNLRGVKSIKVLDIGFRTHNWFCAMLQKLSRHIRDLEVIITLNDHEFKVRTSFVRHQKHALYKNTIYTSLVVRVLPRYLTSKNYGDWNCGGHIVRTRSDFWTSFYVIVHRYAW